MKVAYFSTEFPPRVYGGLGVYVDCISRELTSLGQEISVFVPGDAGLKNHEYVDGVEVFREIPVPMKDGLGAFLSPQTLAWGQGLDLLLDLLSYNQLAASRFLNENRFDLCVAHDWLSLPGAMAVKQRKLPMIYHVHGMEIGRSEHPNSQLVYLEKMGAEVSDLVITVSWAMRQELLEMGVSAEKIFVCHHGVDTDFFDPYRIEGAMLDKLHDKYGFGQDDTIILFLGRLEPVKGVMQLLEAMSEVSERHPEARLLIVGKGILEDKIRAEAKKQSYVTLATDFLSLEEKARHYALADLCVFPSLYEPFGIVALEAAAMEKAAVVGASGVSGLREIVENPASDRPTGVHVNPRDPGDIAWGINQALDDADRLKEWGKNARARILSHFTWRKAATNTLDIYRKVATSLS